ncbi:MAG: hypothetical protein CHACPFDD_00903 [Phycisphaerae bacterium]|nr:hypothetical protein [Phycisphaerae bacterium]
MRRTQITVLLVACSAAPVGLAQPNSDGFVPGHIFTVRYGGGGEMCNANLRNWVDEIDPLTAERWELADRADGLCGMSGLRFSPNGKRLRVLSFWNARVAEIDSAGNVTTAHDASDGIGGPVGSNGLCWDRAGNFYVTDHFYYELMKYPQDRPPKTRIEFGSHYTLTSGPDGNVYFSVSGGEVYVLNQNGRRRRFGDLSRVACIEFDPLGNLFVATWLIDCGGLAIHAYAGVDPTSRRLVTTGFACGNFFAFTFGEDPNTLYATDSEGVYALDVTTGAITTIRASEDLSVYTGAGIACYVPPKKGDLNCDRGVNAFDVDPFIAAVMGDAAYDALAPHCDRMLADLNGDGSVNAFDIDAFIELLTKTP